MVTAPEEETTVHVGYCGTVPFNQATDDVTFDFPTPNSAKSDYFSLVDDGSIPKQNTLDSPTSTISLPNPSHHHQCHQA
jgi:hypothetical protein